MISEAILLQETDPIFAISGHDFCTRFLLSVNKIGNVDDDITLDDFSAGLPTTYFRSDTHMLNISIVTQIP